MIYILYASEGSDTGKALVAELKNQGVNASGGVNPPADQVDVLIRWGSRKPLGRKHKKVIQRADAIASAGDKLQTLLTLKENGIQDHPEIWTQNSPGLRFPCLGRKKEHS